jgi:hypothetical protein
MYNVELYAQRNEQENYLIRLSFGSTQPNWIFV